MKPIQKIAEQLEKLEIAHGERLWVMYTTGIDLGVESAARARTQFLKDKKNFAVIRKFMDKDLDPIDKRGVEILFQTFKWHHVSAKANATFAKIEKLQTSLTDLLNKHRTVLDGREVDATEISKIVNENPDRELRKRAYQATAQVNRPLVEAGFLQLIELRKEYAEATGCEDFISLRLETDELDKNLFKGWDEDLKKRKKEYRKKANEIAQRILGVEVLKPWDLAFVKNILCRENNAQVDIGHFFDPIQKTFAAYGWDIGQLNLTYDVFPRKNKSEWGYNFTLRPGLDSRVLANVNDRFASFNVLLHETAHGVHFLGVNPEERLLNMGISGIVAEGFANFFGGLSYSKEFLTHVFGRDSGDKLQAFHNLRRYDEFNVFNQVLNTLFDHELYRAPLKSNDDICALKVKMGKDLLDQPATEGEIPWGRLIHHTVVPIYLHNYFLGDVMTANLKKTFKKQYGSDAEASPKRFGRFWREKVLKPSGRYTFQELHKNVCGTDVKLGPYLDQCLRVGGLKAPQSVLSEKGRLKDLSI